ncbi:MAG: RNA polymerase sigma factor [Actinobacteria bacterium]|nr:RNA polymerase sigma factor [Actinomycetota bacterium]
MSYAISLPGVRISQLTDAGTHPLDVHVVGIRARSETAFRAVYDALVDDLVSFAYAMLNDRRTAEDVVQQTFVELVEVAHKIRGDGRSLRAWLFKSVRFGCLDEYRRRSRRPEIPHGSVPEAPMTHDPLADHLDPVLEQALKDLSSRQRTAIVLRHVVGLTPEEIAAIIGTTRKATYSVLARAEKSLRERLGGAR